MPKMQPHCVWYHYFRMWSWHVQVDLSCLALGLAIPMGHCTRHGIVLYVVLAYRVACSSGVLQCLRSEYSTVSFRIIHIFLNSLFCDGWDNSLHYLTMYVRNFNLCHWHAMHGHIQLL